MDVLPKYQCIIMPYLTKILSENNEDILWKYWIIKELFPVFKNSPINEVRNESERIAKNPTPAEKLEGLDDILTKLL